jgi:predicted nucleotidyltransferase
VSANPRSIVESYDEALRYFMGEGSLNRALAHLAADLEEHGIDYVVIGAVALFAHGYPRLTEDIDLVFTAEGINKFHEQLIGVGYVPAFPGARKRLRSTRDGVRIDVIASGEYPGDGKPKPVRFPNPLEASVEIDGVRFATLEKLIELKLASGMTAPDRLKDLADVQEMIKIRRLDSEFADKLNPYVREKYLELFAAVGRGRNNNIKEQL